MDMSGKAKSHQSAVINIEKALFLQLFMEFFKELMCV